jgi:hypothetical protein
MTETVADEVQADEVQQDSGHRVWHLNEDDIAPTIAKLERINARAVKQGLTGRYAYRLGEEHREPVYDDEDARMVINGVPHRLEGGQPVPCQLLHTKVTREFIVDGIAPKMAGWSFIATLSWDGETLVTRTVPGFDGRIDACSVRPGDCDHCHTIRQRYDTYLVERETGERKQVGSSCIKDFLGHPFQPSWLSSGGDLDTMEESFGRGRAYLDAQTEDVLTEAHGWISRDKAEIEHRNPSSWLLRDLLFSTSPEARKARQKLAPADDHRALAAKVREWARGVDDTSSEYLANIKRLAGAEVITERNAGMLGSAVAAYNREMQARAEREARPASQWMGQPKDKITVQATVRSDTPVEGDWGIRHRYGFLTREGNWVTWWASSSQGLEVGREVTLTGTVKGHEEYREVKSTVLTRCKISEAQAELEAAS